MNRIKVVGSIAGVMVVMILASLFFVFYTISAIFAGDWLDLVDDYHYLER